METTRSLEKPSVDARLERIEGILDQTPALLASITDTFDELGARLAKTGAPIDQRANGLAVLAEQLTRPETSNAMARIGARFDALEGSVAAVTELPLALAAVTDVIDEFAGKLSDEGVALDQLGARVGGAVGKTVKVLASDELDEGPDKIGVFGLLKALRDPDVQRALALAMRLARAVGKSIDSEDETKERTHG